MKTNDLNWRTLAWHVRCSRGDKWTSHAQKTKSANAFGNSRSVAEPRCCSPPSRSRLARLEPAAPSVSTALRSGPIRCAQGEMLRQVRGPGTLVPREIRWIAAQSAGRVERVIVRPGAVVEPDTILAELSNPDLMRQAEEARYGLEVAKAEFTEFELNAAQPRARSEGGRRVRRVPRTKAQRLQAEAERTAGVVAELDGASVGADSQTSSRRRTTSRSSASISSAQRWTRKSPRSRARLAQDQNAYDRLREQVEALSVRAGLAGVVQQVMIEEGEQVQPGANVARVARPDELHSRAARAGDAGTRRRDRPARRRRYAQRHRRRQSDPHRSGRHRRHGAGRRRDHGQVAARRASRSVGRRHDRDRAAARTPSTRAGPRMASRTPRSSCSSSSTAASTPCRCPSSSAHVGQRRRDRAKAWCPATRSSSPTPRPGTTTIASGLN